MKTALTLAAVLGALSLTAYAQDAGGPPQGGPGGPGGQGGGPGGPGSHRPVPAIIAALDANHDGVIDADEIANASAALKTLDKNGDGKLTRDEYMGKPPGRPPGGGGGGQGGGANNDGPQGPPPGN
ncbi:MAG TPA: EF-hand domain-containing protein [Candidatus Acidoferrales bacterium]|nr:EF-hand domain-containing protein [Candidatus Acidoferrales bacterium]